MSVDAVIFDIGNVLIEWNPERFYDSAIGEARRRAMFDAVDLHGMNDAIDRGADWQTEVAACAARFPDWADEIGMWHSHWIEMARPAIDRSVRLLAALQAKGVPVFSLTNFGIQTHAFAVPHYPFLASFDRAYISGHMGVIKPDPAIYAMVEADCGVAPERLLFTDDRADNIAAAAARGWQTHHFDGPAGWAARLVAEGLLSEAEAA
ncbi:MAG: HAD-IA family hydrolase [Limimaricola sp.]|uniref:HAD family hydrolase n=1 Tax=Limimaricola sp. TaxID=2211665 RepID=UPI001DCBE6FA|nr:HAD family phosphatase [Limimaricola sp.]MBI1418739.1 HAD-IA family hydrolase [Limimaricola sp.]